jgi:predicted PolB exonuclease-like 3'-5' exonuclease
MVWPVLVFDIETIPDIDGLRLLNPEGHALTDEQVHAAWLQERQAKGQSDFLPLYLQRVLVISCVFRNSEGLRIHSFTDRDGASEGKIVQTFFNAIEKHTPQLVSWNGSGFDLPVLHYRGLRHGVVADKYWDMGDDDREFKWNNYIARYHQRHLDLMDLLAMYTAKNNAPLDALAKLCGFPGKLGMDGSQVYAQYRAGQTNDIQNYCETDVMNTYLMYCRYQKMRGGFTEKEYDAEIEFVQSTLGELTPHAPHWH